MIKSIIKKEVLQRISLVTFKEHLALLTITKKILNHMKGLLSFIVHLLWQKK